MKLSEFSKNVQLVIDFPTKSNRVAVLEHIKSSFNVLFNHWAFIVHDKDVDGFGNRKRDHVHAVCCLEGRSRRLQSTLNSICELASLPSECVSILPCVDLNRSIRYLCHLDNPEKAQYLWTSVVTDSSSWLFIHQKAEEALSIDYLIDLIKECDGNQLQIARSLGLLNFQKYRGIVKQLLDSALCEKNRENSDSHGAIDSNSNPFDAMSSEN